MTIRHRRAEATIYGRTTHYKRYRLAYRLAGKRRLLSFGTYKEAKAEAERVVRELSQGSPSSVLTANESRDALAALEQLQSLYKATGRRISLKSAVSEFTEAVQKLQGRSLTLCEALERFLSTSATVKPRLIQEAVAEYIEARRPQAEAKEGKRAQLSPVYFYNFSMWLREFSATFPGTTLSELTKEHLGIYMASHAKLSAKSRNDRRATVKMLLSWAVKQDYLPTNHRLLEAACMEREIVESQETDYFRPEELQNLLNNADTDLLPVIALGGLAGLRGEEIMRLDWANVWRTEGHIEITAQKSKTRQRRLVEICPALAEWLAPYRQKSGKVWNQSIDASQEAFARLRDSLGIPARRNGLRHGFCTYHFALHSNENLTSAQAGNSPAMIHKHYKGLATKGEAERWFASRPRLDDKRTALR